MSVCGLEVSCWRDSTDWLQLLICGGISLRTIQTLETYWPRVLTLHFSEWLHPAPHRSQEEPDGHCHHADWIRRHAQRRVQERIHATAPGRAGGTHRHGVSAARAQGRCQLQGKGENLKHWERILYSWIPVSLLCTFWGRPISRSLTSCHFFNSRDIMMLPKRRLNSGWVHSDYSCLQHWYVHKNCVNDSHLQQWKG